MSVVYTLRHGRYHCVFLRTRLVISVGGFLTTIHNIIDVARQRLYLYGCQHSFFTLEIASPSECRYPVLP